MRRDRLLTGIDNIATLRGLEIGALDKPLLLRSEGEVVYVDYTDTESLKRRYADFPDHDVDKIVHVDAVWGENTLSDALQALAPVDFVVASHVIEHVPDLITWLNEISSVLALGGTAHFAIPDRRYCFDIRRRETSLADVLYAYTVRARRPLPHLTMDFCVNFQAVDTRAIWDGEIAALSDPSTQQIEHGIAVTREVIRTGEYFDIHCWVFTPLSFARLMLQLAEAGLISFSCHRWFDTAPYELEFMVILKKSTDAAVITAGWQAMVDELSIPT